MRWKNLHRDAKSSTLTYLNLCLNAFKKDFLLWRWISKIHSFAWTGVRFTNSLSNEFLRFF